MSIEQDIKRMADANERIADAIEFVVASIKGEGGLVDTVKKPKKLAKEGPVAVPAVPINEAPVVPLAQVAAPVSTGIAGFQPPTGVPTATFNPVPPPNVGEMTNTVPVIRSGEELRMMAQRIAQKLGANTMPFVNWVNTMLAPYGVTTVAALPADKLQEFAVKLDGYAYAKGITY